jgi:hypothetical protein
VYDETGDVLLIARDGAVPPVRLAEPVVEVGAEPAEFQEQGIGWVRVPGPSPGSVVYAPAELQDRLLTPDAFVALGLA